MEIKYDPENFLDAMAGLSFGLSMLLCFVSLCKGLRAQATRLIAVLLIAALALFSDNGWVYAVSIFIIATTITETEFLQNLAAIFRGNKDYFKYKIAKIPAEAVLQQKQEEAEALSKTKLANEEQVPPDGTPDEKAKAETDEAPVTAERLISIENAALDKISEIRGIEIQRNVRITSSTLSVEFDGWHQGIAHTTYDDGVTVIYPPDEIFEVRYLADNYSKPVIQSAVLRLLNKAKVFERVGGGSDTMYNLILVSDRALPENIVTLVKSLSYERGIESVQTFKTDELITDEAA